MKIPRWLSVVVCVGAILAFVGFSPSTALADSLPPDPGVRLSCPPCTTQIIGPGQTTFTFNVVVGDGTVNNPTVNDFSFINDSGFDATSLTLTTPTPGVGTFTCLSGFDAYFTTCTPLSNGVEFSGLNSDAGQVGILTAISLSCDGTCTSNPTNSEFGVQVQNTATGAIPFTMDGVLGVPEPSTILLLLVGLGFLSLLLRTARFPSLSLKS